MGVQEEMLSPEKRSELSSRRALYSEAKRSVSRQRVVEITSAMHAKINQSITGGPFQLRRAFKQFDRSASGHINLDDFRAALNEKYTLAVTDEEVTAVFAYFD